MWQGEGAVRIDGQARPGAMSPVRVEGDAPHTVQIGATQLHLPARDVDPCGALDIVALGDGRAAIDGIGPSAGWRGVLGEALSTRPDLILNTGDLVKRGGNPREWRQWLLSLPSWPPVVPVKGNHDRGGIFEALGYSGAPAERWLWGPVEIIAVNTEAPAKALISAVREALAHPPDRWRVLVTHRPIWSRGNHGSDDRGLNAALVPLIDAHGVHLVLSGHDHDYERFCPSRGLGPQRCAPGGTTYVVTGGAATFTVPVPGLSRKVSDEIAEADSEASVYFSGAHHFVTLEIEPRRLTLTAHRTLTGNLRPPGVMDRLVLERDAEGCDR